MACWKIPEESDTVTRRIFPGKTYVLACSGVIFSRSPAPCNSLRRVRISGFPRRERVRYRLSRFKCAFSAIFAIPPLASATFRKARRKTSRAFSPLWQNCRRSME